MLRKAGRRWIKSSPNFAFSLLSHAKDINGSLNVLIEQIGKKYGLGFAMVFEYREEQQEMVLMNYWNRDGSRWNNRYSHNRLQCSGSMEIGRFVSDANGRYINGGSQLGGGEISWNFHQKLWKCKV